MTSAPLSVPKWDKNRVKTWFRAAHRQFGQCPIAHHHAPMPAAFRPLGARRSRRCDHRTRTSIFGRGGFHPPTSDRNPGAAQSARAPWLHPAHRAAHPGTNSSGILRPKASRDRCGGPRRLDLALLPPAGAYQRPRRLSGRRGGERQDETCLIYAESGRTDPSKTRERLTRRAAPPRETGTEGWPSGLRQRS